MDKTVLKKGRFIRSEMTVLDVVSRYRKTEAVFKQYDKQAGECICCQALFDPLKKVAIKYGLNLEKLMADLESADDQLELNLRDTKMSTRAIQYLNKKGVNFRVVEYEHHEKGAEFAARAIGFPLERTIKTLVIDLGNKKYSFALMPGDKQLALKQLAKVCKVKRAAMVDTATAERLTGYLVGGISPFGAKQNLRAVIEESLLKFDNVAINAGQRGVMLIMEPEDIVKALECDVAGIV